VRHFERFQCCLHPSPVTVALPDSGCLDSTTTCVLLVDHISHSEIQPYAYVTTPSAGTRRRILLFGIRSFLLDDLPPPPLGQFPLSISFYLNVKKTKLTNDYLRSGSRDGTSREKRPCECSSDPIFLHF